MGLFTKHERYHVKRKKGKVELVKVPLDRKGEPMKELTREEQFFPSRKQRKAVSKKRWKEIKKAGKKVDRTARNIGKWANSFERKGSSLLHGSSKQPRKKKSSRKQEIVIRVAGSGSSSSGGKHKKRQSTNAFDNIGGWI